MATTVGKIPTRSTVVPEIVVNADLLEKAVTLDLGSPKGLNLKLSIDPEASEVLETALRVARRRLDGGKK